jgi:hypothetical protein
MTNQSDSARDPSADHCKEPPVDPPTRSLNRRRLLKAAVTAAPVVLLLTTRDALAQGSGLSGEGSE